MTMITPSYLGDTIEYSSYASSLVPSSDPLVTAASVLEFALLQGLQIQKLFKVDERSWVDLITTAQSQMFE